MSQVSISFVPHLPAHIAARAENSPFEYSNGAATSVERKATAEPNTSVERNASAKGDAISHNGVRRPTFALYTLGCKVNQYDSHQISRALTQRGFRRVEFRECADLYVIDTCTVTAEADRKSRKAAGRAHRNNIDAVVAVTGCAAAYARDQFLQVAPNALVLDNSRKLELPELAIAELQKRASWANEYSMLREQIGSEPMPSSTRERAVLKIQDGCNHNCSYCIIPTVRGASVVKSRANVMSEARAFVREGARELIITGVSMSDWGRGGKDEGGRKEEVASSTRSSSFVSSSSLARRRNAELCDLIRAVATIEGLERVRVSSLDPADVDDEFLEIVARTPNVCPHIHLALQSGSAQVLRNMRRRYTPSVFLKAAQRWREIRPDGGLTTDIIVGFPGESDDDFEYSMQMAREANFSAIHVFPYSPRAGTVAAGLGNFVAPAVQKKRVEQLIALGSELSSRYAAQFVGQVVPVLIEAGGSEGLTPHYLKAKIDVPSSTRFASEAEMPQVGDIAHLRISRWNGNAVEGELVVGNF